MKYSFDVQEPYKTFLINWKKIVEWRLNKWKFKKIQKWDILYLETWEEFEIVDKNYYKSFYEMMGKEWLENVLPDKNDIQEWIESVYYKFYSKELEEKYGVCAIKLIKN